MLFLIFCVYSILIFLLFVQYYTVHIMVTVVEQAHTFLLIWQFTEYRLGWVGEERDGA